MKGTNDTVVRLVKKQAVLCFSFPSIDIGTLVTYKLQQHGFYGSSYSCQEELSFFFKYIIKKPAFP